MKIQNAPHKYSGIIPSQTAIRFCASYLRRLEHAARMDAIVFGRLNLEKEKVSLLEQADDVRQVAQFLEERLLTHPTRAKK